MSGLEIPHVETFQTSTEVTAGSQMELVCAVSGKPQPTVYWTKGTDRIEPNKGTGFTGLALIRNSKLCLIWAVRVTLIGTNLIIYNADLSDSGDYICHAVNSAGEDMITVTLDVQTPATIVTEDQSHTIVEGDPLEVSINPNLALWLVNFSYLVV